MGEKKVERKQDNVEPEEVGEVKNEEEEERKEEQEEKYGKDD